MPTRKKVVQRSTRVVRVGAKKPARPARSVESAAELRARLGLTRPIFARLAGASERTVADWEHAEGPKPGSERALREIRSVVEACERVMKPEFVGRWLVTPNDALGGFKVIELIERGETARVLRALFFVEAGTPL